VSALGRHLFLLPHIGTIVRLVLTRLDYGNSVVAGLPVYLNRRLQSVLDATARLILYGLLCMAASGWIGIIHYIHTYVHTSQAER